MNILIYGFAYFMYFFMFLVALYLYSLIGWYFYTVTFNINVDKAIDPNITYRDIYIGHLKSIAIGFIFSSCVLLIVCLIGIVFGSIFS